MVSQSKDVYLGIFLEDKLEAMSVTTAHAAAQVALHFIAAINHVGISFVAIVIYYREFFISVIDQSAAAGMISGVRITH